MIKDENFINIQGWMINRLNLKGNELVIFSVIYGFSQDGEQWFEGSRQYLADWCNSTKQGIQKSLKSLVGKGYLIKEDVMVNNVKFCKYKVDLECITVDNKVSYPSKQSLPPQTTKFTAPSKQSLPNNINNTIDDTIDYKKESKKESKPATPKEPKNKKSADSGYDDILKEYVKDKDLIELYVEFIKMRKLIKAPLTDRALKILIKRVNALEPDSIERQKELLDTAIMNNWKTVYELKGTGKSKNTSYNTKEYESTNIFDQLLDKQKDVRIIDGDDIF